MFVNQIDLLINFIMFSEIDSVMCVAVVLMAVHVSDAINNFTRTCKMRE